MAIMLTPQQIADYHRQGYLLVENLLTAEEIDAFTSHIADWDDPRYGGLHNHQNDDRWHYLATHPNIAGVAAHILSGMPRVVQTMYMPKKAAGGKVGIAFHQDTHYLLTEPNTLMACWIAMSDTDESNGGLCVVPGSHQGELRSTHKSAGEESLNWTHTHLMRDRDGKEWEQQFYSFEIDGLSPDDLQPLTVKRGSGVFFTGMTVHGSYANQSITQDRLAWAVHYLRDGSWIFRADVQDTMPVPDVWPQTPAG